MPKAYIKVHVVARREAPGSRWIAGSPELDVWSSGGTPQEAFERAAEALSLFLVTAAEMGTLEGLLAEAGIRLYADPSAVPADGVFERVRNAVRGDSFPLQLTVPLAPGASAVAP